MTNMERDPLDYHAKFNRLLDETLDATLQAKQPASVDTSLRSLLWYPLGIAAGMVFTVSAITVIAIKIFTN